jgi:ubiquinone biosynthesis protein COQ9
MNTVAKFTSRLSKAQSTRRSLLSPTVTTTRSATTSTSTNNSTNKTSTNNSMENVKNTLARAALKQVPRHGWTQDAIAAAASEDPKLSISMSGMLSPSELIGWFMDDMNLQLRTKKDDKSDESGGDDHDNRQFKAIQWRLQQVLPFVESGQWHKGMAMGLSTPLATQSQLHEFIELISPDNNSSTSYHTALGAIFVATELHLLTDSSPNYADTWSFLRSRLNELERHQKEYGGDVDPSRFLLQLASSAPVPSLSSLVNMTNSIPVAAGMAVAQSLVEGAASLVFPQSSRVLVPPMSMNKQQPQTMTGTKASDYESPSSSTTRNQN